MVPDDVTHAVVVHLAARDDVITDFRRNPELTRDQLVASVVQQVRSGALIIMAKPGDNCDVVVPCTSIDHIEIITYIEPRNAVQPEPLDQPAREVPGLATPPWQSPATVPESPTIM